MARPPNSWVWQHFRHLSQGDNYSNVECVMCNKAFRYSSRNGPTNLARHINKSHGLHQPSVIARRPFSASGVPSDNGGNSNDNSDNNNSNNNSNNNNENNGVKRQKTSSNGNSNDDSIVGVNQESNSFNHVDNNNSRLTGVVSNGVLDLGNDSFNSSQLLGNSPSSNGLVLNNKYPVHDYSDPISRRVATSTPTFRLEQLPSHRTNNSTRLSISQQQPQSQQQQQQQQQTQSQQQQQNQAQSQQAQSLAAQQSQQSTQQRSSNSLESQVVGNSLYDHPELYNPNGNQNQNYSVIIQSIIHTQSQIQQSLRNLERSNIRIEQKFARTTNLTRGSGLDDKYELVPFSSGLDPKAIEPRLPLLYDIFTLFNCSNEVLDIYLNNYEITRNPHRQEKIFKLANFIGCNDIEKYWNDYTGIFRNSNVVGLDGSKLD